MPRGNATQTQVFYKGTTDVVFTIFVDDQEMVRKWKDDSSIPLAQVVSGFKILVPEHGKQGILNTASKSQLENEFETSDEDAVIKIILERGDIQTSENAERQGATNDSKGSMLAH